jgi:hypothetical protein
MTLGKATDNRMPLLAEKMDDEVRRVRQRIGDGVRVQWDGPFPNIDDGDEFLNVQDERAFAEQERERDRTIDAAIANIHGWEQSIPRMLQTIFQAADGVHILSFYVEN